ncbi:hypothetical protein KXR87_08435 [Yokenella regensburgei]|uniref:hypothetical protein n=1 Tax=Yokenella regensburgei TaxID=158877 RepID=UPI003F149901
MNKELSCAAGDVLHALFFRGALANGDLPSKAGAAELRELGFVKTQDTVAAFRGENHYNFLTAAGQEFAISYLVEGDFGKQPQFKTEDGHVFINEAFISGRIFSASSVKSWEQTVDERFTELATSLVKAAISKELNPGGLLR